MVLRALLRLRVYSASSRLYKIIASFEGSKAYYGSYAEKFINVEEAPERRPEPTASPAYPATIYILPATIGIIIAIVVVGLIIILMLRKRQTPKKQLNFPLFLNLGINGRLREAINTFPKIG